MRVLIIIAHCDPTKKATAYRFAKAAEDALVAAGNEVKVTDIVHEGFDRVATENDFHKIDNNGLENFNYIENQREDNLIDAIKKQQAMLTWCTHVVIIGAMYYYRYPACLYAWIERVFTKNFAFTFDNGQHAIFDQGLLKGRKVTCIITCGDRESHFSTTGYAPLDSFLYPTTYAFRYVGFTPTVSMGYFSANIPEYVAKEGEWLEKFKKAIVKLDQWPLLPMTKGTPQPGEKNEGQLYGEINPVTVDQIIAL